MPGSTQLHNTQTHTIMGASVSKINPFSSKAERVLIVGLDGSGKTTLLYKLKLDGVITTIPPIGMYCVVLVVCMCCGL